MGMAQELDRLRQENTVLRNTIVQQGVDMVLPRPTMYTALYAYSASAGQWLWQTSQVFDTEEDAVAYCMTLPTVEKVVIVKIEGLEKWVPPATLKTTTQHEGEIIEYVADGTEDE